MKEQNTTIEIIVSEIKCACGAPTVQFRDPDDYSGDYTVYAWSCTECGEYDEADNVSPY
jgi:hypothetical protein